MIKVDKSIDPLFGLGIGLFHLHDVDTGAVPDQALALRRVSGVGRVVKEERGGCIPVLKGRDDQDWVGVGVLVGRGED